MKIDDSAEYESYVASEFDEEKDALPTPKDVKRETCPKCGTSDYVRPFITGLIKPDERLWEEMAKGRISVEFNCEVNRFWEYDCKRCHVRFEDRLDEDVSASRG